jgi:hypothetical protein
MTCRTRGLDNQAVRPSFRNTGLTKAECKMITFGFKRQKNYQSANGMHLNLDDRPIEAYKRPITLSQPHFGQVWGWSPTLSKLGIWSPPGFPNVQSSTARPKTPRIEMFLVSLKRSWNVNIENGLALVIWTSAAQVMGKRRAGSQTGSLTSDH